MNLLVNQPFTTKNEMELEFKIECDALDSADLITIADIVGPKLPPFKQVLGVPSGGIRLAKAFEPYENKVHAPSLPFLIVDDVWTTGKSMTNFTRYLNNWIGFVIFVRSENGFGTPDHVHYMFKMANHMSYK